MVTYSISDLLIRVKNASRARQRVVDVSFSKVGIAVLRVLEKEGYVTKIEEKEGEFRAYLAYKRRKPVLSGIRVWSRPGVRVYRGKNDFPRPLGGLGIAIISTSKGIMTGREASKQGLGGELLAEVW